MWRRSYYIIFRQSRYYETAMRMSIFLQCLAVGFLAYLNTPFMRADTTKVDLLRGDVQVEWQKQESLPYASMGNHQGYVRDTNLYILTSHSNHFGVHIRKYDLQLNRLASYVRLSPDTTGYIPSACRASFLSDGTIRLYGTWCWLYTVPPLKLSRYSWDFSPYRLDLRPDLTLIGEKIFDEGCRPSMMIPSFGLSDASGSVVTLTTSEDSLRLDSYASDLSWGERLVDQPRTPVLRYVGTSNEPVILDNGDVAFHVLELRKQDSATSGVSCVYYYNPTKRKVRRVLIDTVAAGKVSFRKDGSFYYLTDHRTDSTKTVRLRYYDTEGQLVWSVLPAPQYSMPAYYLTVSRSGGVYVHGIMMSKRDAGQSNDSLKDAIIIKVKADGHVAWYHVTGRESRYECFVNVTEGRGTDVYALGTSFDSLGKNVLFVTKYREPADTSGSTSVSAFPLPTDVTLTPSPVRDVAVVRFLSPATGTSDLCLTGLTGTRIKSFPPVMNDGREQETTLSLHDVPAGYYLLEVRTSDSVRHVPVIVAR